MTRLRALLQERQAGGTTADAVYRTLRHGIIHGDLRPGERLRYETTPFPY